MAIETIRTSIRTALEDYSDTKLRNLLAKRGINQTRITEENSVAAFIQGTNNIMTGAGYDAEYINDINSQYNTPAAWKQVLVDIYDELNSISEVTSNHELKNIRDIGAAKFNEVYILSSSTPSNIIIRIYGSESGGRGANLDKFLAAFRRLAFDKWRENLPSSDSKLSAVSVEKGSGGTRFPKRSDPSDPAGEYASAAFGRATPFAHDNETTVGKFGLQAILNELGSNQDLEEALQFKGLENFSTDFVKNVMDSVGITYTEQEIEMPDGGTRFIRSMEVGLIEGELRRQGVEDADWRRIRPQVLPSLEATLSEKVAAMNPDQAMEAEGSPSARTRIKEKAVEKIVKAATLKNKRAKVKKAPKKTRKTKPKKINISGKRIARKKIKDFSNIRNITLTGKKLQAKRREEGSDSALSLAKLKTQLNRRLPAEVRRNMGRPALRNQTGRFSNSVYITSLKQAQKTIVGEYTYQLDPYETFENTGFKRWPSGYNPKPLITKSIRNLATQYVESKFTLRRV